MKRNLSYEVIETQPRDFDFGQGYTERWDIPLSLTDEERDNEEYIPMMNYVYPLGKAFSVPDDFRKRLANCTIVEIDGEYYLALTCGGMDCSWEICETYINLGYFPPVHFCRLPRMAGRGTDRKDRMIINCCNESLGTLARRCEQRLQDNKASFGKPKADTRRDEE